MGASGVPPLTREEELILEMQRAGGVAPVAPPVVAALTHQQPAMPSIVDQASRFDAVAPPAPAVSATAPILGSKLIGVTAPRLPDAPTPPIPPPPPPPMPPPAPLVAPRARSGARKASPAPTAAPATPGVDVRGEEAKALTKQDELSAQAISAEQREGEVKKEIAIAEQESAAEKVRLAQQAQAQQQTALDSANKRTQAWLDKSEAEADKFAKMEIKDYWADKSTGSKVLAGIAMLFGAAGRTGGDNPGMRIIDNAIERDYRTQQARIEKQRMNVTAAREGLQAASVQKQELLADLGLKKAAAYEAAAAQAESLKRKSGVSAEQAATDKNVVALKQKASTIRLDTLNTIHDHNVKDEQVKIQQGQLGVAQGHLGVSRGQLQLERDKFNAAKAAAAAGAGAGGSAATADVTELNKIQGDLGELNRLVGNIAKNPKGWNEYKENTKDWMQKEKGAESSRVFKEIRGLGQAVGLANVSPEQGLKSESAKQIHQGMQNALTAIAKGYGGVITDGDRQAAAAALSQLSLDPQGALNTINRLRNKYETQLNNLVTNRGVVPTAPVTTAPPAMAATAPAGAGGRRPPPEVIQAASRAVRDPKATQAQRDKARAILLGLSGG